MAASAFISVHPSSICYNVAMLRLTINVMKKTGAATPDAYSFNHCQQADQHLHRRAEREQQLFL